MSAFNCRANVSGIFAGFEAVSWHSSFYGKQYSGMAFIIGVNEELLQIWY
jgi:hypothetical protein